jgi:hypothetical protein
MVISVTTYETRQAISVTVNGQRIDRHEVTKIYVIEPYRHGHGSEAPAAAVPSRLPIRPERLLLWGVMAVAWMIWLARAFGWCADLHYNRMSAAISAALSDMAE